MNLEKSDLIQLLFINTKGGIRRLLPPVPHGGSGMNTGGGDNYFIFISLLLVRSFTADSNLLKPTGGGEQNTLTRQNFSHLHALITVSHTTLAQYVCPHHVILASCAVFFLILFDSPLCTLHRVSHLPFHSPDLHLHLPCGLVRGEVHSASANEELGTFGRQQSSHKK